MKVTATHTYTLELTHDEMRVLRIALGRLSNDQVREGLNAQGYDDATIERIISADVSWDVYSGVKGAVGW